MAAQHVTLSFLLDWMGFDRPILGGEVARSGPAVDGRNPPNQLRLVVSPIIYRVLAPSQVVVWDF